MQSISRRSVALVTGGSRGIGRAVIRALVEGGCGAVAVNYRSTDIAVVQVTNWRHELTVDYLINWLYSVPL
jgi:NAD(P)-dependent dehydrogenase (short-subunit alcohol dehydrogenase family)